MNWPPIEKLQAMVKLPNGFSIDQLARDEVPSLTRLVQDWYPTIQVGMESVHLREEFFYEETFLAGENPRKNFPFVFKKDGELVGLVTLTHIPESKVLTGRLGVFSPNIRGHGIGNTFASLVDGVAELMHLEAMYFFATLQHPITQKIFEHAGMQIVGIVPGYDIDQFADGVVRRVPEAIFAKVLVEKSQLFTPEPKGMTAKTKRLWDFLKTEGAGKGFWA